jgi:hypothetical protein
MHPKIKIAYHCLREECEAHGTLISYKSPRKENVKNAILVTSDKGHLASIGITPDGDFKCLIKDNSRLKWAMAEGFSTEDINSKLKDEVFPEVSLMELCRIFNGEKVSNFR